MFNVFTCNVEQQGRVFCGASISDQFKGVACSFCVKPETMKCHCWKIHMGKSNFFESFPWHIRNIFQ